MWNPYQGVSWDDGHTWWDFEETTDLLVQALDLLEEAEWASTIWTDTISCPWCEGLRDESLPETEESPYQPKGHQPDCPWLKLMQKAGRR